MEPGERYQFLDALPEEAWRRNENVVEDAHLEPAPTAVNLEVEEEPAAAPPPPHVESVPIIEARQIEKYFQQPEGREIQVVAPPDLSVRAEYNSGPSRSFGNRRPSIPRMSFWTSATFPGRNRFGTDSRYRDRGRMWRSSSKFRFISMAECC